MNHRKRVAVVTAAALLLGQLCTAGAAEWSSGPWNADSGDTPLPNQSQVNWATPYISVDGAKEVHSYGNAWLYLLDGAGTVSASRQRITSLSAVRAILEDVKIYRRGDEVPATEQYVTTGTWQAHQNRGGVRISKDFATYQEAVDYLQQQGIAVTANNPTLASFQASVPDSGSYCMLIQQESKPSSVAVFQSGQRFTRQADDVVAQVIQVKTYVDGKVARIAYPGTQRPAVYSIEGQPSYKLRDLAALLRGTAKTFSVGWDASASAISLTSGGSYSLSAEDLQGTPWYGEDGVLVKPSTLTLMVDGQQQQISAYSIDSNTYVQLEDIMRMFDVHVSYGEESEVLLDTSRSYGA